MAIQKTTKSKKSPVDTYIHKKIKLLKEFTVVNEGNEEEIKGMLYDAVKKYSNRNHEIIVDAVARHLIKQKLNEYEEYGGI